MSKTLKTLLTTAAIVVAALPALAQHAGHRNAHPTRPNEMATLADARVAATDVSYLAAAEAFVAHYDQSFDKAVNAWPGFALREIPKVIVFRNASGTVRALITVDHPNPEALGTVTAMPSTKGKVALVTAVAGDVDFSWLQNFEFSTNVAGAPSFVIAANCEDPEFPTDCVDNPDFTAYFLHEAFHRYQEDAFRNMVFEDQEVYDYSAENLYLALLENALLVRIERTEDKATLQALVRDLVALRAYRASQFQFVGLDEAQERIEGTARFVEDAIKPNPSAETIEWLETNYQYGDIKAEFGFGRFYVTGAVMMNALVKLEIDGAIDQVTAGATPMQVLASEFPATAPAEDVTERLKAELDPQGTMARNAATYAEWAKTEPGIFDE